MADLLFDEEEFRIKTGGQPLEIIEEVIPPIDYQVLSMLENSYVKFLNGEPSKGCNACFCEYKGITDFWPKRHTCK